MTLLEEVARERTRATVGTTISRATEKIAEEMANEILRDPQWRAEMQVMIRGFFKDAMTTLQKPARRTHGKSRTRGKQ